MTHPQVFGQKFTPFRRFSAWKTHPFWPHIPNMTQYGSAPPPSAVLVTTEKQAKQTASIFVARKIAEQLLKTALPEVHTDSLLKIRGILGR